MTANPSEHSRWNVSKALPTSLEGKSLWILQSLPVDTWKIYQAKIRMQLILTGVPMLLCIVCITTVYSLYLSQLLMIFLFAASYVWFMALTGLLLGIKMPVLTWTNEIMPIKHGAPVMITLFGGFVYMALLFAGFMLLSGWILGFCGYMSCFVGVNLFISVLVYLWLRKKGVAILEAL